MPPRGVSRAPRKFAAEQDYTFAQSKLGMHVLCSFHGNGVRTRTCRHCGGSRALQKRRARWAGNARLAIAIRACVDPGEIFATGDGNGVDMFGPDDGVNLPGWRAHTSSELYSGWLTHWG